MGAFLTPGVTASCSVACTMCGICMPGTGVSPLACCPSAASSPMATDVADCDCIDYVCAQRWLLRLLAGEVWSCEERWSAGDEM